MMDDVDFGQRRGPFPSAQRPFANTASMSRLILLIAYFSVRVPEFRTWNNALLILLQVSVIGIIAVGMTFTIITAGIDLSVGSLLGCCRHHVGDFRAEGSDGSEHDPCLRRCRLQSGSSAVR